MLSVNGLILVFGFGFMMGLIFDFILKLIRRSNRPDIYENILDALNEWADVVGEKELEALRDKSNVPGVKDIMPVVFDIESVSNET